jgi:hypothetical protein
MTQAEPKVSARATSIARGLLLTERAFGVISLEYGMLRLSCRSGGNYWIEIDGGRTYRGETFLNADELQPKFSEAMERAGR